MIRFNRKALALCAITMVASSPADGRALHHPTAAIPKRQAVLLDFSRAPDAEPAQPGLLPIDPASAANVARQMESAFTNSGMQNHADLTPNFGAGTTTPLSLPNPFLTRALVTMPSMAAPAFYAGGSCALPEYLPDYSHGRAAEARRRMIFPLVHQVACEQGLPVGLFDALIMQESRYNHLAVSPKGALGLAQLMPGTARQLGANPFGVIDNLRGGARYLRQQVDRFGRYDLALAAYNSGPGRVARLGRVPLISETTDYVRRIFANWTVSGRAIASTRRSTTRSASVTRYAPDRSVQAF